MDGSTGGWGDDEERSTARSRTRSMNTNQSRNSKSSRAFTRSSYYSSLTDEPSIIIPKKRLGSYTNKVKIIIIIEPLIVGALIIFWIMVMLNSGTFSTESDFNETDIHHRTLERIRDNHRIVSFKKKKKLQPLFYVFTVITSTLVLLGNYLVAFDTKNKMAACLAWLFIHAWWMFVCFMQVIRGIYNSTELINMPQEIKEEDIWLSTRHELIFVNIFYTAFFFVDIVFSQIVHNRFLYLRKEAKSAQHSAGKRFLMTIKKRKSIRMRQKEKYRILQEQTRSQFTHID